MKIDKVWRMVCSEMPKDPLHDDPVCRVSRLVGLYPFTSQLNFSTPHYCIGLTIFLIVHTHRFLVGFNLFYETHIVILLFSLLFTCSATWVFALVRVINLQKLRMTLQQIDQLEKQTGVKHRSSPALFFPFVWMILKIIITQIVEQTVSRGLIDISHGLFRSATFLINGQYAALAGRCSAINHLNSRLVSVGSSRHLYGLAHTHARLCRISQAVNQHYGLPLLLTFLVLFVQITLSSFLIITQFETMNYFVWSVLISELFYTATVAIIIVHASYKLEKQTEEFYEKLVNLMMSKESLCSDYKLRMYMKVHPTVSTTACEYFHVGYPLFSSVLAGSISYLIILIQFAKLK